ncbi:hypothetical protein V6N11_063927 [Hibiscus sabdariffa]|uniref:Xyloglucan endotransglucosylase/hydrolase n=1 Tax=Hibiscus sabdariffa TaxID=183260 RepID=A0ABR2PMU4_9ROSI
MGNFWFPAMLLLSIFVASFSVASASDFHQEFDLTWGDQRAQILNGGELLTLTLDKASGSGFRSKREYLFGRIDMQIKLVAGNSAGTVTAFYLSSEGPNHDEIDFEFLGNLSGDPYIVHTNVYCQGKGDREQQFYLWFDPTKNFHTYSIVWNQQRILFLVDNIPIRVFNNEESIGVPFPKNQPMRIYSSLWDADNWATRGGLVKTDWSKAPFKAYYRNFNANACTWSNAESNCASQMLNSAGNNVWRTQALDASGRRRLRWVQRYFMVYNYCADLKRFPQGRPRECRHSRITPAGNSSIVPGPNIMKPETMGNFDSTELQCAKTYIHLPVPGKRHRYMVFRTYGRKSIWYCLGNLKVQKQKLAYDYDIYQGIAYPRSFVVATAELAVAAFFLSL